MTTDLEHLLKKHLAATHSWVPWLTNQCWNTQTAHTVWKYTKNSKQYTFMCTTWFHCVPALWTELVADVLGNRKSFHSIYAFANTAFLIGHRTEPAAVDANSFWIPLAFSNRCVFTVWQHKEQRTWTWTWPLCRPRTSNWPDVRTTTTNTDRLNQNTMSTANKDR